MLKVFKNFLSFLEEYEDNNIGAYLSDETEEVSELVSGYIVRNIINNNYCEECKLIMISKENEELPKKYLQDVYNCYVLAIVRRPI